MTLILVNKKIKEIKQNEKFENNSFCSYCLAQVVMSTLRLFEQFLKNAFGRHRRFDAEFGFQDLLQFLILVFNGGAFALCGIDTHYKRMNIFAVRVIAQNFRRIMKSLHPIFFFEGEFRHTL